jgi:hypothetical protein
MTTHSIFLAPQAGVPESEHLDATRFQKRIAFTSLACCSRVPCGKPSSSMSTQASDRRSQECAAEGMLAAKSVAGEPPVAQPTPQKFLGPRVFLAQHACDARELGVSWTQSRLAANPSQARWFTERFSPSPGPLPWGEGEPFAAADESDAPDRSMPSRLEQTRARTARERADLRKTRDGCSAKNHDAGLDASVPVS